MCVNTNTHTQTWTGVHSLTHTHTHTPSLAVSSNRCGISVLWRHDPCRQGVACFLSHVEDLVRIAMASSAQPIPSLFVIPQICLSSSDKHQPENSSSSSGLQ